MSTEFKPGDKVECVLTGDEQNARRTRDNAKAKKERARGFLSRAAAYMHRDEAYVVEGISPRGGLRLRGFAALVSPKDVRISTLPVIR